MLFTARLLKQHSRYFTLDEERPPLRKFATNIKMSTFFPFCSVYRVCTVQYVLRLICAGFIPALIGTPPLFGMSFLWGESNFARMSRIYRTCHADSPARQHHPFGRKFENSLKSGRHLIHTKTQHSTQRCEESSRLLSSLHAAPWTFIPTT